MVDMNRSDLVDSSERIQFLEGKLSYKRLKTDLVLFVSTFFILSFVSFVFTDLYYMQEKMYCVYSIIFAYIVLVFLIYISVMRYLKHIINDRDKLERIIDSINPDVLLLLGRDRKIKACTGTVKNMFGYSVQEVLGQDSGILYGDRRLTQKPGEIYESIKNQGFHVGAAQGKRKNGKSVPLEIITGELKGQSGVVLLLRDITQRVLIEKELTEARAKEVKVAGSIQQSLLISDPPKTLTNVNVAAMTIPSQEADGDFYDFISYNSDVFDFIIGDVMGKGVSAALLAAGAKSQIQNSITSMITTAKDFHIPSPKEIMMSVHASIVQELINLESFLTMCYARFEDNLLTYVDCGHPPIMYYEDSTGDILQLKGDNMPIGFQLRETYVETKQIIKTGDVLVFYSDGITEAMNFDGEMFGEERLAEVVRNASKESAQSVLSVIHSQVTDFLGGKPAGDDLTCIVIKVIPKEIEEIKFSVNKDFTCELSNLGLIRQMFTDFITEHSDDCNLSSADINLLLIALNEAASNVIQHACHADNDMKLNLSLRLYEDRLVIEFAHLGDSFVTNKAKNVKDKSFHESGYGLYIIEESVDKVYYFRDDTGLNIMKMVKFFNI
jgi:sigma-B regulation protein RsbU (phosphoserine phosphatase)